MSNNRPDAALPSIMLDAIDALATRAQAHPSLALVAVLGACSAIVQSDVDLILPEGQISPAGVFLIGIADSGSGKSAVFEPLRVGLAEIQVRFAASKKERWQQHNNLMRARTARQKAILRQITETDDNIEADRLSAALMRMYANALQSPKIPRWLLGELTPSALLRSLATDCSFGAILTDEGSALIGKRTASDVSQLVKLWDGRPVHIESRSTRLEIEEGARLTILAFVQGERFQHFLGRRGQEARGSGFLARCLMVAPEIFTGYRDFSIPYFGRAPAVSALLDRLAVIARGVVVRNEANPNNAWNRVSMTIDKEALQQWLNYKGWVGGYTQPGQWLENAGDFASKLPMHALRLAAIAARMESDACVVCAHHMDAGIRLAQYFALEYVKLLAMPPLLTNRESRAQKLEHYLRSLYIGMLGAPQTVEKRFLMRNGPAETRREDNLMVAINDLVNRGLIDVIPSPRGTNFQVRYPSGRNLLQFRAQFGQAISCTSSI